MEPNATPRPSAASLIDGAPEPPEATLQQVQRQLQNDEQAWFTSYLVEALQVAGEFQATPETLPDYAPRLSMRRYPDGVVIIALDAQPETELRRATIGRVLFGLGAAEVQVPAPYLAEPGPLRIVRPILTGYQALAYEIGRNPWQIIDVKAD